MTSVLYLPRHCSRLGSAVGAACCGVGGPVPSALFSSIGRNPADLILCRQAAGGSMRKMRKRSGAIRLPIVDVDGLLEGLKRPNTRKSLIGARRQVVEKTVQMLEA